MITTSRHPILMTVKYSTGTVHYKYIQKSCPEIVILKKVPIEDYSSNLLDSYLTLKYRYVLLCRYVLFLPVPVMLRLTQWVLCSYCALRLS